MRTIFSHSTLAVQDSERLINMLRFLKLDHLVERCGGLDKVVDWDWNHVLTPGESQRLSILRIFYHRPAVAFMDEVTSAIGADYEKQVYETLRTVRRRDCSFNRSSTFTAFISSSRASFEWSWFIHSQCNRLIRLNHHIKAILSQSALRFNNSVQQIKCMHHPSLDLDNKNENRIMGKIYSVIIIMVKTSANATQTYTACD
ncbi:putative ABC efflux transporter, permease/ATP-binding protein [Trichinella spiralis]|uniref:putative ABC efflux transporter, permease/ATP-binding protein n=1 Tax=Trichinella spiralis TaxID=6334 RepID=UPI0001EFCFA1|nr:putative ABC efflux transporter, permease/ATP-binding protein [Trichinella spiralis]